MGIQLLQGRKMVPDSGKMAPAVSGQAALWHQHGSADVPDHIVPLFPGADIPAGCVLHGKKKGGISGGHAKNCRKTELHN